MPRQIAIRLYPFGPMLWLRDDLGGVTYSWLVFGHGVQELVIPVGREIDAMAAVSTSIN